MVRDVADSDPAGMEPADARGNSAPDALSLTAIIAEFQRPIYQYAYRLTGSVADAEDLTQQTFLLAHQRLHQLRDRLRLGSWLFSITRNCFLQNRRRPRPLTAAFAELNVDEIPQPLCESPFDVQALQQAILELPDEFRIVVLMFYFEELPYRTIAEQLDIPIGTVMSRLSRGKSHLRARLLQREQATVRRMPAEERRVSAASDSRTSVTPVGFSHG